MGKNQNKELTRLLNVKVEDYLVDGLSGVSFQALVSFQLRPFGGCRIPR
jgi:hypothetical protein